MAGVDACRQGGRVESVGWATSPAATGRFEQASRVIQQAKQSNSRRADMCSTVPDRGTQQPNSCTHHLRFTDALTRHGDWHAIADQAPGRLGTLKGDGQLDLQGDVYSTWTA